jgi:hypothetical protein
MAEDKHIGPETIVPANDNTPFTACIAGAVRIGVQGTVAMGMR